MYAKEIAKEFGKESKLYTQYLGVYEDTCKDALICTEDIEKCVNGPLNTSYLADTHRHKAYDKRSVAWLKLATDIKKRKVSIPKDPELINTLKQVRYCVTRSGAVKILSKNDHLKAGVDLDKADCLLLAYM